MKESITWISIEVQNIFDKGRTYDFEIKKVLNRNSIKKIIY